ncbi:MAG: hypothetical protein LBJ15_17650 [Comamonas sp.]|jgi:hypothetical protein|uniref:hypothetical protein n=1 Tax=Comamonas sp. TaxID=34028 RepID=UPI00281BAA92|nr:hypothetical protein [Comamonas sp.]MDR0215804.1 hypothetical protein [Comamonas sp.]
MEWDFPACVASWSILGKQQLLAGGTTYIQSHPSAAGMKKVWKGLFVSYESLKA